MTGAITHARPSRPRYGPSVPTFVVGLRPGGRIVIFLRAIAPGSVRTEPTPERPQRAPPPRTGRPKRAVALRRRAARTVRPRSGPRATQPRRRGTGRRLAVRAR